MGFYRSNFFLKLALLLSLGFSASGSWAFFEENTFLKAKEAYASKNLTLLNQQIAELKSKDYLLTPYAEYWAMLLRLEQADDIEIMTFIESMERYPFANRLRGEWLKKLARQENWALFAEQYAKFQGEDVGLQCESLYGQLQTGSAIDTAQLKKLWLTSQEQPSQCQRLFDANIENGTIHSELMAQRLRLALLDNRTVLAKAILQKMPNADASQLKLIDVASQTPSKFLNQRLISAKSRLGEALSLAAFDQLARENIEKAVDKFHDLQPLYDAELKNEIWLRIAYHAARALNEQAMRYYGNAKNLNLTEELRETSIYREAFAWRMRAALRAQAWQEVLNTVAMMSEKQAQESAWRYWKARGLLATKPNVPEATLEADAILVQLAKERHYYGWLAAEAMTASISNTPEPPYVSTPEEVAQIANLPEIKRAQALQNLDMRWEAKMEWQMATRNMNDQALIAAATYALKQKWYDTAILTADSTKKMHNFELRYPTPYREYFKYAADDEQVDEAWVYGLVRQESRFMDYAKSSVGASGLMQLMPATAKWAAKRKGLIGYSNAMIHDLRTNIALGTYYMRHTLDTLNGQAVLATAAYNAGPGRAKKWMANTPMEAAIYIETIPFSETRNYVQKVMANAQMYASRLGLEMKPLKERLGVIPAKKE
jgi:soluble lytic murein transglycosylase